MRGTCSSRTSVPLRQAELGDLRLDVRPVVRLAADLEPPQIGERLVLSRRDGLVGQLKDCDAERRLLLHRDEEEVELGNPALDPYTSRNFDISIERYLGDLSYNPENSLVRETIWEAILQGLEELPAEQKYVFVKNEFEGISFREMSEETGVNINTLLARKRYAVLYLRKKLQDLYDTVNES